MRFIEADTWSYTDKEFIKQRKLEWKSVTEVLKQIPSVSGSYLKLHKELFFKGEISDESAIENYGGHPFGHCIPFFVMWYHPNPSSELYEKIVSNIRTENITLLRHCRNLLLENQSFRISPKMDRDYGMFGGREELLTSVLIRSDTNEERWVEEHSYYELGIHPRVLCGHVLNLIDILEGKSYSNPFSPGRYLVGRLDRVITVALDDEFNFRLFKNLVQLVLNFNDRPGLHREDKHSIAIREELFEPFNKRIYSKEMLDVWDSIADRL